MLLAGARAALQAGNAKLFYHEVEETLWSVTAEKCDVLPSVLNKETVKFRLAGKGVSPELIRDLSAILDECEWALYTPDQSPHDMEKLLTNSEQVVKALLDV